ncbi:MAG: DUF4258 domain-containing protein [Trueperaceae bacterium]|nr:MAG: DUF4258 domain-containing protein [Trueperaceae bacterium]
MDELTQGPNQGRSTTRERSTKRKVGPKHRTLDDLRPLVRQGRYRIGSHAINHASCEGFTERDMVSTILHGRELMRYWEDERLLVLGYLQVSPEVRIPIHVVIEYSRARWVDIITAFIPFDPHRVISRTRLAEFLRYDKHEPESRLVGKQKSP